MHEIEIQLQQSYGVESQITALCASGVEYWLLGWKNARERDLEYYTCLLGILGEACRKMTVQDRTGDNLEKSVLFFSSLPFCFFSTY